MKAMNRFKMTVLGALFAGGIAAVPAAQAAVVTQWSVGVVGQFLCDTAQFDGPGGSCAAQTMNWGTSTGPGQSGLDITNPAAATLVNTNGAAVPNMLVTHRNQPITGTSLEEVSLRSTLTLKPNVPDLPGLPAATLDFLIDFYETPNGDNPCADGGVNGVGVNSAGCSDIFVIDQQSLNFPFQYDTDGPGGDPELTYFISFFELTGGLNPLPVVACNSVLGPENDVCLGFRTPEGANTTFQFAALITTEPVVIPEPGTLAALSTGLLALGALRRRRRA